MLKESGYYYFKGSLPLLLCLAEEVREKRHHLNSRGSG